MRDAAAIDALQDRLFAEGKRALLVVLQGIDCSGKDGTVRAVFNHCGPIGVKVTPFKAPTADELAQDYLWRVHKACPPKGYIGIFNRSHYEDVLVVKVRSLRAAEAIERRYDEINAFEKTARPTMARRSSSSCSTSRRRSRPSACASASRCRRSAGSSIPPISRTARCGTTT